MTDDRSLASLFALVDPERRISMTKQQLLDARERILLDHERGRITLEEALRRLLVLRALRTAS